MEVFVQGYGAGALRCRARLGRPRAQALTQEAAVERRPSYRCEEAASTRAVQVRSRSPRARRAVTDEVLQCQRFTAV